EEGKAYQAIVAVEYAVEVSAEPLIEAALVGRPPWAAAGPLAGFRLLLRHRFGVALQQLGAEERHYGHGHGVGGEQREHYCDRERGERIAAEGAQKRHREENHYRGQGCCEDG